MRKTLTFLVLLLLNLIGCRKETVLPDTNSSNLTVASQATWKTEPLNSDYTIQFPSGYEGTGMVGFEGPIFNKNRVDKQTTFTYAFCGSLNCNSYGLEIPIPYPSIPYPPTITFAGILLDQSVSINRNGQLQAVFYFAKKAQTQGLLYLKDPAKGLLRQSLNVSYQYALHTEVLGILQTIQPN